MRLLTRFRRDARGLSVIVQFLFVFLLMLGFFGGFAAYSLALYARSVVIQAAYNAARTASIQCSTNPSGWYANTVSAAQMSLQDGHLKLTSFSDPSSTSQPGVWDVTTNGCAGGVATVTVSYNQVDLFPPLGPVLLAGASNGWSFYLQSSATFPVE